MFQEKEGFFKGLKSPENYLFTRLKDRLLDFQGRGGGGGAGRDKGREKEEGLHKQFMSIQN